VSGRQPGPSGDHAVPGPAVVTGVDEKSQSGALPWQLTPAGIASTSK